MNLAGKNVVYLGGFGGIGEKTCNEILEHRLQALAIFDLTLNEKILTQWQLKYPNTKIFYQKVDITEKSQIEEAYKVAKERLGHFDLVINGMGFLDDRRIVLTLQINLLGVINSCLIALEHMDKSKGGRGGMIVNISSVAGIEPTPIMSVYSASKHGVTAFTRCLAGPFFASSGVSFVTVCPGMTATTLINNMEDRTIYKFDIPPELDANKMKRQSVQVCAKNIVKVVQQAKNGSAWLLDVGELKEIEFPVMWIPPMDS
ncbi:alcohol dehydrogenase 1-like isoform X1 [Drosophila nasuta]|uniref:alcohol dehydrogenase 1-like isoform X1 n=2 Tax=Drosophila nasuta TaxID=42062 RepID=UPI00295EAC3E|nr:alcohol dehydrogenase 1-like isoform X1 [Drosophila nasuta]